MCVECQKVFCILEVYVLTPYIPAPAGVGCQINLCILLLGVVCIYPHPTYIVRVFSHPTYLRPQVQGVRKSSVFYCMLEVRVGCQKFFCILLRGIMYIYSRPCIYSHPTYLRPQVQGVRKSSVFYCMVSYVYSHTLHTCAHRRKVSKRLLYSTAWYHVYILTPMYILTPYIPAPTGAGCQKVFYILCMLSYVYTPTLSTCAHGCRVSDKLLYSTAWYVYTHTLHTCAHRCGYQKDFYILLRGIVCKFSHPTYLRPQGTTACVTRRIHFGKNHHFGARCCRF